MWYNIMNYFEQNTKLTVSAVRIAGEEAYVWKH